MQYFIHLSALKLYIYSISNSYVTHRYNPQRDNSNAPSLSKGWAYFEHFTLPRRFESKSGGHHIRAPPGEAKHTRLYGAFMTPQESLSGKRYICGRLMC